MSPFGGSLNGWLQNGVYNNNPKRFNEICNENFR